MQKFSHGTRSFDGFTLDLTRGRLLRGAEEIKLPPKPYDALKYLVENPGRLISKSELIQALWPDTAVTDDSLVQCLREVRRALRDDSQQIIRTVPRRGYIFDREVTTSAGMMAPVTTVTEETGVQLIIEEEEENGHSVIETTPLPTSRSVALLPQHKATKIERLASLIRQHRWTTALGILTLAVAVSAAIYFSRPGETIDSIAVMPFVNATGDPNVEYLSDGISDGIINELSQLPSLKRVIAFNSVLLYKGKPTDPQAVATKLNVRAVLMGRVTQQGDNLSISIELVDARENKRLWGGQFDRKKSQLSFVPNELARQVADHLRIKLTAADEQQLNKQDTQTPEAYEALLKGNYFWNRGQNQKALKLYQQAVDLDANYALAYNGLASCYLAMADLGVLRPDEAYPKAGFAAMRAMDLDRTSPDPHISLAQVKLGYEWDWPGSEDECKRAMELDSNAGHGVHAIYLSSLARYEEAIAEARRAMAVDPISPRTNNMLSSMFYLARQYDQAIEQYKKALELDPNNVNAHRGLGLCYEQKQMYAEAIAEFQKVRDATGGHGGAMALGVVYAQSGRRADALKIIDELRKRSESEYVPAFWFAAIYAGLREKDQAFEWLEKAFHDRDSGMKGLKGNPYFDNLRSDPRFSSLLQRMHMPA